MNGRGMVAIGVLAAWGVGIAVFAQRELSRSPRERLAELAMRVSPGATYFAMHRDGRHVGFASTTLDTVPGGLQVTDYFVADVPEGEGLRRATGQSVVRLSRALLLRDVTITTGGGGDNGGAGATGRVVGDTLLELVRHAGATSAETTHVQLTAPLFVPSLVPMIVALGERPAVGDRHRFEVLDPVTLAVAPLQLSVLAESLFVVVDSAAFDSNSRRWVGAHADTVRAWRLADGAAFDGWVDELGRLVTLQGPAGHTLRRTAYETAFENWRTASPLTRRAPASDTPLPTATEANLSRAPAPLDSATLVLRGIDLAALAVHGGNQERRSDTVVVRRDGPATLRPSFSVPLRGNDRQRYAAELRAEPLLEIEHPAIVALARRLRGRDAGPDGITRRIVQWISDSIATDASPTLHSAVATLRSRRGDANDQAQLFVALARAAGVPARPVSGLLIADGRVYRHTWGEVMLQRWVPADPAFGEFPADASHLRLTAGSVHLDTELARLLERTQVEVLATFPATRS